MLSDGAKSFLKEREAILKRAENNLCREPEEEFVWEINHPRAPHRQGVVESLVRLVKEAISMSFDINKGKARSRDEWELILCRITYVLNSRPLVSEEKAWEALQVDGNWILHPYLETTNNPCTTDIIESGESGMKRFWDKWYRSVIPEMFKYPKWEKEEQNMEVDDVVLVTRPRHGQGISERGKWPRAIVREIKLSKDGVVRKVIVEYETGKREKHVVQNLIRWAPAKLAQKESLLDQFQNSTDPSN